MDILTHALASYALKRAAFPRIPRLATAAMLIAGIAANIDWLSRYLGPSIYLNLHRTYCHSFLAALLFSMLASLPFSLAKSAPDEKRISPSSVFPAALAASFLHLLIDLTQSSGVELLWPFSARRFALDWTARIDLWVPGILLAGILLPMLSGLVTEEIGAKRKGPKGRVGASLALIVMVLYFAARFVLHGNAVAALESRSYRGESPRKTAAFAESGSPFRWHGIVETESALQEVEVDVGPGAQFDPDSAITSYKPEPSIALDAARDSPVARRFLAVARFPKATVEKIPEGFRVTLRAFPYRQDSQSERNVEAQIETDASGKITSQSLEWDKSSP
jgi:membrane-bound metal-dependent hydrolase YbcI (DUF457 family)